MSESRKLEFPTTPIKKRGQKLKEAKPGDLRFRTDGRRMSIEAPPPIESNDLPKEVIEKMNPEERFNINAIGLTQPIKISNKDTFYGEPGDMYVLKSGSELFFRDEKPSVERFGGELYVFRHITIKEFHGRRNYPAYFVTHIENPHYKPNRKQLDAYKKRVGRVFNPDYEKPLKVKTEN